MADSVRRFFVGRDRTSTALQFRIAAALTVAAFGTLAVPAFWEGYVSAQGAEAMQLATAAGFVLSVIAAVYVVAKSAEINPYVPTAAVFVVLTSYGVTGVVSQSQLVFFVAPAIFLGILTALAAYANDGALPALSIVFFPVLGYMINAPYGLAEGFDTADRVRIALVFSLLFTLSIGIAGFLTGVAIRRLVDYADLLTVEQLRDPDTPLAEAIVDRQSGDDADDTPTAESVDDDQPRTAGDG
ncbi:MAG: hypothetical protein R6V31_00045 [Halohasta sp.]